MRLSQSFAKTTKDISKEEVSLNAQLLIKGGYVNKLMAGVYSYLPLGLRVLTNIENIVRDEMNKIGGQEVLLPALQPREIWDATGRWDEVDVLFKLKGAGDKDLTLGATHEEVITPLAMSMISSYKDMPVSAYQIQTKFRNEARAKSGILRGREFRMKDLYSFHTSQDCLNDYYLKAKGAYENVFARCGLGDITFFTHADGGAFSKYSHEFQTLTESGEDIIYLIPGTNEAINEEIINNIEALKELVPNYKEGDEKNFKAVKAAEVANIFKLSTKFTGAINMTVQDAEGKQVTPVMGCYGIGTSRLMGTIAECLSDDKGLVWPTEIAPYKVHMVTIVKGDEEVALCDKVYTDLNKANLDTIIDDRAKVSVGAKLAEADLLGMPYRVVIGKKTLEQESAEVTCRKTGETEMVKLENLVSFLQEKLA
jgi:prolyl-tRNA synthetase